jgi:hypothetical protein
MGFFDKKTSGKKEFGISDLLPYLPMILQFLSVMVDDDTQAKQKAIAKLIYDFCTPPNLAMCSSTLITGAMMLQSNQQAWFTASIKTTRPMEGDALPYQPDIIIEIYKQSNGPVELYGTVELSKVNQNDILILLHYHWKWTNRTRCRVMSLTLF